MKKNILYTALAAGLLTVAGTLSSCRKVVDCALEGTFTSISATPDGTNVKQYSFKPNYYGSHTVNSVTWDFGDGQQATTNGLETVTHVYTAAGSKTVKASISTKYKSTTCTIKPEKTIEVQ